MKFRKVEPGSWFEYEFECPGCKCLHGIRTAGWPRPGRILNSEEEKLWNNKWTFNGDVDRPTVMPSIHVHFTNSKGVRQTMCHSFVENGQIRFLGDCSHDLRGQTVALPDL